MSVRRQISNFLWNLNLRTSRTYSKEDFKKSAVIFSPHPDDETLACGGTICLKKRSGADVNIVFMTDGSRSHERLMPRHKLKSIRAGEAAACAQVLGIRRQDLIYLDYEDGMLFQNRHSAIGKTIEILDHFRPQEIFIPHHKETHSDHCATQQIVISALERCGFQASIMKYPLWLWSHWPWVGFEKRPFREIPESIMALLDANTAFLFDFNLFIDIREALGIKRVATDQYKSQMTRLIPDQRWKTLSDVANGEFLNLFFRNHEVFMKL